MVITVNGLALETNKEGFLCDLNDWNDDVAKEIASINNIVLEVGHWEIVHFIRNYYKQYQHLPNARVFTKAIRNQMGVEKGNSRYLHHLFPEGPLKYACKIAGLPKPPTCL